MMERMFPPGSASRARMRSLAMSNPFRWWPRRVQAMALRALRVFDAEWYLAATQAAIARKSAALHFANNAGAARSANPMFDADWYRNRYGFQGTPAEALLHYALLGDRLGLQPVPWFNPRFFRRHYGIGRHVGSSLSVFLHDWKTRPLGHPLFDSAWYLGRYADVRESGQNPLVHFVVHGLAEGRQPNAFLDPHWYLDSHADVRAVGMPAALHFCLFGAAELRSPGPEFDAAGYAVRYALLQGPTGLDPLAHYLIQGRAAGFDIGGASIPEKQLTGEPAHESDATGNADAGAPATVVIDVVIPIYGGYAETRACIESVMASASFPAMRLHLYNDASPEPAITEYLRELVALHPAITLQENPRNLGFVGTVNRAMKAVASVGDFSAVLLLNSDTIVAGDWVERLARHAANDEAVATVTALSNNATICSYPTIGVNAMPEGESTAHVDRLAAQCNAGLAVDVPTGVGFCMLISQRALQRLGYFDEEAFGRGYGEEVDFCRRAAAAGMRNLLAMDVFVRHVGEVSFADSSHPGKAAAARILAERYPDYSASVGAFVNADPALVGRLRLSFARWREQRATRPVEVIFTHALGGGTERHVQEVVAELREQREVIILRPSKSHRERVHLEHPSTYDPFECEITVGDARGLARLLRALGTGHVQIHHLLGFGDYVREALALSDCTFDFVVHDYFTVCPQVNLIQRDARYCGERGLAQCDACIAERPSHGAVDIRNWRLMHEWMLLGADTLLAPSQDAARRIARYTGRMPVVRYHEPAPSAPLAENLPARKRDGVYRIGIVGVLAPHKGRATVLDAARHAAAARLPLHFHVIGDTQGEIELALRGHLSWTGAYRGEDLPHLIAEADLSAFLFAAPWPETYSYTLTAAMQTGLPILATRLGAFPERLEEYPGALVFDWELSGAEVAERIYRHLSQREAAHA